MFKDALFSIAPERTIEAVETRAGTTYVRTITVREKDEMDEQIRINKETRVPVLLACCCKRDGTPEFDEFDVHRLGNLPAGIVEPIIDAALRLNSFRAEDVEDVRKNSGNGRTAPSDSASVSS